MSRDNRLPACACFFRGMGWGFRLRGREAREWFRYCKKCGRVSKQPSPVWMVPAEARATSFELL